MINRIKLPHIPIFHTPAFDLPPIDIPVFHTPAFDLPPIDIPVYDTPVFNFSAFDTPAFNYPPLEISPFVFFDLIDQMGDPQKNGHLQLAERGWFPDPSMPLLYPKKLAGQPDEIIDEIFSEWLRDQVDEIEASLATSHPGRARHLHQAFNAHRRGEYSLSTPAFLTQADGICHARFSRTVFIKSERKNTYEQHGSQVTPLARYLFLFTQPLPLWATKTERDEWFDELNRHLVLHGIDIDYDTEKNSLKALSFLRWIDYMTHLPTRESESVVAV